jgi:hypothetical protein
MGQQLRFAAAGFDFLFSLGGKPMGLDRQWLRQGSIAENLDSLVFTPQKSLFGEERWRYFAPRWARFQLLQINDRHFNSKGIMEAALWKTPLERHLAAFEPRAGASSRPSALSLVAPARGLPVAGAISPAYALPFIVGTLRRSQIA